MWEGYSEPTWESLQSFVKDTAPLVERYLLKKSLMKPLHIYSELKRLKSLDFKPEKLTPSQMKDLKAQFAGLEQLLFQP